MMFKPELAALVMAGEKTVTRRVVSDNPRSPWYRDVCGVRVGQSVAICPGRGVTAIGRATVTSVERQPLGFITEREARAEGFTGSPEFEETFSRLNGGYDPDLDVWRIGLGDPVPASSTPTQEG